MTIARMLCAVVALAAVAGCEAALEREQVGSAAVERLLEAKIGDDKGKLPVTAPGTLLGAYRGSDVGKSLDTTDRRHAEETAEQSLGTSPAKETSRWSNPDTGNNGTAKIDSVYRTGDGKLCKDFTQTINAGGKSETMRGTSCQESDGTWMVL